MSKKIWSEGDIEYLKKFYPELGAVIIADDLNLPVKTVRNKVKILKLQRVNLPNRWSKEEVEFLKKFYPEKGAPFVAKELNRPLISIRNKVRRMKLKGHLPYRWSEEDVALLKKYYPKYNADKVAEKLGRKRNAVIDKACALKLRKCHKWTEFEKNFLKKNYNIKPLKTISKVLRIPLKAVSDMAYSLKLYEVRDQKWTDEQIASLNLLFPDRSIPLEDICSFLGRSKNGVIGMAHKLKLKRYGIIGIPEIKYLAANYKTLTYKEMALNLGVSADTVRRYCAKKGFIRQSLTEWSQEQINFLKNNYKSMSIHDLSKSLGRTESAIHQMAHLQGVKKFPK